MGRGEYLSVPAEKRSGLASEHGANDDVNHAKLECTADIKTE